MDTNADVIAHLRAGIATQEQIVADARTLLDHYETGLEVLHNALRVIEGQPGSGVSNGGSMGPAATTKAARSRAVTPDIDLSGVQVDFTGTENLRERLIRIAETAPGTYLNVTQTVKLLIRHGQSEASVHNGRVSVQRAFDTNLDIFERVEAHRATYRYVGGDRQPDAATGLAIHHDQPAQQESGT